MNNKKGREQLVEIFSKYDTFDVLTLLSALNLHFPNQNKEHLINIATSIALQNINDSGFKCSKNIINKIINAINELPQNYDLPTSDQSFIDQVSFNGTYHIFCGVNESNSYILSNFIDAIFHDEKAPFSTSYMNDAKTIVQFLLLISNYIYSKNIDFIGPYCDVKKMLEDLICQPYISKSKDSIVFPMEDIYHLCDKSLFDRYLKYDGKNNAYEFNTYVKYPDFFAKPFYCVDDKCVVLDPCSLAYSCICALLELAKSYNCLDLLMTRFHDCSFNSIKFNMSYFMRLNDDSDYFNKFHINKSEIKGIRQHLFKVDSSNYLYLFFIENGNPNDISRVYKDSINRYNDYLNNVFNELKKQGIDKDDVVILFVIENFLNLINPYTYLKDFDNYIYYRSNFLQDVLINEEGNRYFFFDYVKAKRFYDFDPRNSDELWTTFIHEHSKNYSFYLNDDKPMRSLSNCLIDHAFEYGYRYNASLNRKHESALFTRKLVKLCNVEKNIYVLDYYLFHPDFYIECVKINSYYIWITTYDSSNKINWILLRILSYWYSELTPDISDIIDRNYYFVISKNNEKCIYGKFEQESIFNIFCDYDFILNELSQGNNDIETEFIETSFNIFIKLGEDVLSKIKEIFEEKSKRVLPSMNYCGEENLRIVENSEPLKTSTILKGIAQDLVGKFCIDKLGLKTGVISNHQEVLDKVADYLMDIIFKELDRYDWFESVKYCYKKASTCISRILAYNQKNKQIKDINPDKSFELDEIYKSLNNYSATYKFICEYFLAVRPNGKRILGDVDLQYLNSLIETVSGYETCRDAFRFDLMDPNLFELLKSERLGTDVEFAYKFEDSLYSKIFLDLEKPFNPHAKLENEKLKEKSNDIYKKEYGYSLTDLENVYSACINAGYSINKEAIVKFTVDEIIKLSNPALVSKEVLSDVLDKLSIHKRDKFIQKGIFLNDVLPWEYNRRESLLRKPFIKIDDNTYMWSNPLILNSMVHIYNCFISGIDPGVKSDGPISKYNGEINNEIGNNFNKFCFNKLKNRIPNIRFEMNVENVNGHKISWDGENILGDIDILGIDYECKNIYLIETKKISFVRNPKELYREICNFFGDSDDAREYLVKELNRVKWVKENIILFKNEYNLMDDIWNVKYTFVTNVDLVSLDIINKGINQINIRDIDLNYLRKLK